MTQSPPPPGWYADPSGTHAHRWWDGAQWTEDVQDAPAPAEQQWGAAQAAAPEPVRTMYDPDRIQRQVGEAGGAHAQGGGHLFTEPVLVVNQKTKLVELTNEYAVFDQNGQQVGSVVEVGQGMVKKAVRLFTSWDQYLTHRLEVRDHTGTVQLQLTRPAKIVKSKVVVSRPDGGEIGTIVQENVFGKIRFGLMVGGQRVGAINAENWRAWNFSIVDANEQEIARITKTWEGLARTMFTSADNYVVHIHRPLDDPLRSLVVASALTVDTALKQDERGLN